MLKKIGIPVTFILLSLISFAGQSPIVYSHTLSDEPLTLTWKLNSYFGQTGSSKIQVAENDGGYPEIICGATNSRNNCLYNDHWFVMSYKPDQTDYAPRYFSDYAPGDCIIRIFHQELTPFGQDKICIVTTKGKVKIYDRVTCSLEKEYDFDFKNLEDAGIGDCNGDDNPDLIILDKERTHIYDLETGTQITNFPFGGESLDIGQMDDDPIFETRNFPVGYSEFNIIPIFEWPPGVPILSGNFMAAILTPEIDAILGHYGFSSFTTPY